MKLLTCVCMPMAVMLLVCNFVWYPSLLQSPRFVTAAAAVRNRRLAQAHMHAHEATKAAGEQAHAAQLDDVLTHAKRTEGEKGVQPTGGVGISKEEEEDVEMLKEEEEEAIVPVRLEEDELEVKESIARRGWVVAKDRWQTLTDLPVNHETLDQLAGYCDEFLIHAADIEGLCQGVDVELIDLLQYNQ